ncbi:hypothetical protein F5X99DRAFT_426276 [Biscogniauxia marginata]|nr:hypothetical protein F5X99DRAFT_426276 [Biscogniauxia marginata]
MAKYLYPNPEDPDMWMNTFNPQLSTSTNQPHTRHPQPYPTPSYPTQNTQEIQMIQNRWVQPVPNNNIYAQQHHVPTLNDFIPAAPMDLGGQPRFDTNVQQPIQPTMGVPPFSFIPPNAIHGYQSVARFNPLKGFPSDMNFSDPTLISNQYNKPPESANTHDPSNMEHEKQNEPRLDPENIGTAVHPININPSPELEVSRTVNRRQRKTGISATPKREKKPANPKKRSASKRNVDAPEAKRPKRQSDSSCKSFACEECRRTKKKCALQIKKNRYMRTLDCTNCLSKGCTCIYGGKDGRTNDTETHQLEEILTKYRALAMEFLTQLELMSCQRHTEQGILAHKYLRAGRNPSVIVSQIIMPKPDLFFVDYIPALQGFKRGYEKLTERRAAVANAEKTGRRVLASLASVLIRCLNDQLPEAEAVRILKFARQGRYRDCDNFEDSTCDQQLDKWYPDELMPLEGQKYAPSPKATFQPRIPDGILYVPYGSEANFPGEDFSDEDPSDEASQAAPQQTIDVAKTDIVAPARPAPEPQQNLEEVLDPNILDYRLEAAAPVRQEGSTEQQTPPSRDPVESTIEDGFMAFFDFPSFGSGGAGTDNTTSRPVTSEDDTAVGTSETANDGEEIVAAAAAVAAAPPPDFSEQDSYFASLFNGEYDEPVNFAEQGGDYEDISNMTDAALERWFAE